MKSPHAQKHERKTVGAKPSTPDSDNTSAPGASVDKDAQLQSQDSWRNNGPPLEGGLSKGHSV